MIVLTRLDKKNILCLIFFTSINLGYSQDAKQILNQEIDSNNHTSILYNVVEKSYNSFKQDTTISIINYFQEKQNSTFGLNYMFHSYHLKHDSAKFRKEQIYLDDTLFYFFYEEPKCLFSTIDNKILYRHIVVNRRYHTKVSPFLIKLFYQDLLNDELAEKYNIGFDFRLKNDTMINGNNCYHIEIVTNGGYLIGSYNYSKNDSVTSVNQFYLRKEDFMPIKLQFSSFIENTYTTAYIEFVAFDFQILQTDSKELSINSPEFIMSGANNLRDYIQYLKIEYGFEPKRIPILNAP